MVKVGKKLVKSCRGRKVGEEEKLVRKKRVVWRDLADSNWGGRSRHSSPAIHSYVYPKTHTSGTNALTNAKDKKDKHKI